MLAFCLGHGPKIAEGSGYDTAAIFRKAAQLKHGTAYLLALRHGEAFHRLIVLEDAIPLFRAHTVELSDAITHALLRLRGKLAEAWFTLKRALLLGHGKVAMAAHPFGEMPLVAGPRTLPAIALRTGVRAGGLSHDIGPIRATPTLRRLGDALACREAGGEDEK